MHPNVRRAHDTIWTKFYHPETQQLYDNEITDPAVFPTREQVIACVPCANAPNPVNDPTLQASWILTANLRGFALTGREEYAHKARRLFQGMTRLAALARTPGYVPRGSVPGHDVVYPNSSVDQYTGFLYALWRYWRSPVATEAEKALAVRLALNAARLIESFHHDVPCDDGLPSFYGNMSAIEDPFRGSRLLMLYRTAFLMSADEHWDRLYREKVEEQGRKRLRAFLRPEDNPPPKPVCNWSLWQNQTAFRMLLETETDPDLRRAYAHALDEEAKVALPRLGGWEACLEEPERLVAPDRWRAFWPAFVKAYPHHDRRRTTPPLHHHVFAQFCREKAGEIALPKEMLDRATIAQGTPGYHLQMLAIAMYAEDPSLRREAAREGLRMLTVPDFSRPGSCGALKCIEVAYWRGVEDGLFPAG